MNEIDRLLSDGASLEEIHKARLDPDERELDKELQRRPYTNDGENHD